MPAPIRGSPGGRRPVRQSHRMTALLAATFWLAGVAGVASEEIRGYASVRSGSQIAIGKRVIHLFGVDAKAAFSMARQTAPAE